MATVFNNNGANVRGDLKAVVRAILTDTEARDLTLAALPTFGKLREPVIRFTHLMRATGAKAANGRNSIWWLDSPEDGLGQSPLLAPSVFNFFSPFFARPGAIAKAGLVSPEFQIHTETQVVGTANFLSERAVEPRLRVRGRRAAEDGPHAVDGDRRHHGHAGRPVEPRVHRQLDVRGDPRDAGQGDQRDPRDQSSASGFARR